MGGICKKTDNQTLDTPTKSLAPRNFEQKEEFVYKPPVTVFKVMRKAWEYTDESKIKDQKTLVMILAFIPVGK